MTLVATHRCVRCLLVPIALLALASCGDSAKVLSNGDARILVGSDDGNNMAGIGFGGRVSMVGGCLGLDDSVVIWPPGTRVVSGDPLTIDVPGLGSVAVGDSIGGGGLDYEGREPPNGLQIPPSCEGQSLVSFFPNR